MDTINEPQYGQTESDERGGAAVAADRRQSERVSQQLPAWVGGESSNRAARGRHVVVHDLSLGGVGFHDPAGTYRPGATHWLIVNGGPMRLSTRMRIVSVRDNPDGGYDVGAAFF